MDDLERLAHEKALAMRTEERLSALENKSFKIESVVLVGNGEPSIRSEVRRLAEEVADIREIRKAVNELHAWAKERKEAQKSSNGRWSGLIDKALGSVITGVVVLLMGWVGWSIKTYLETL